jgi:hypothetical protein
MKYFKKTIIYLILTALVIPIATSAAMQSTNYVIYENVMHSFDGPVITNVASSISARVATITWDTNVASDAFVVYSTDGALLSSKEQGTSNKSSSTHTVVMSGLAENTTYYYRVRSERVNGGITTDPTIRTFTTGADPVVTPVVTPPSASGGMLIIDKTDKVPPTITDVNVTGVSFSSVKVTWKTDEKATGFVEYGATTTYGQTYGQWSTSTDHAITLVNLNPSTYYNFRVLSSDSWGNVAYSPNKVFTTAAGEGKEAIVDVTPTSTPATVDTNNIIINFLSRLFPEISLNQWGKNPLDTIMSRTDITNMIAAPILSGAPTVTVTANEATIGWTTDINANSIVAVAPEGAYKAGAAEPYQQITGSPEVYSTDHSVKIYNLTADTLYHFQLRSKPELGPTAKSRDFTFKTTLEELTITSFFSQIINDQTAAFKWVTNAAADSSVTFAPYYNNVPAMDQAKTIRDNTVTAIHDILISEFTGGTQYYVEISSKDSAGNVARQTFDRFTTAKDDLPPTIDHIKADSTIFVDQGNKIQTIISWLTNEPSTSRVYYQEGVRSGDSELSESTSENTNYTKEHVMVITKFKPGIVYSFKVVSIDSGGNETLSKVHTFMTAKKKDSIIQIIMNILENTFGWMNKIIK